MYFNKKKERGKKDKERMNKKKMKTYVR